MLIFPAQRKTLQCSMVNAGRSLLMAQLRKSITRWLAGAILAGGVTAAPFAWAQFSPALFQNDSYWGDGKAEFDLFDARIVREGIARPCEVLHILVREPFDPKQLVKADDWKR